MKQGDIVPIEFPFSDLTERKLRPAVILSNDKYNKNKNLILAGIYGKKVPVSVMLSSTELIQKKLKKQSFVSLQNIFSAEYTLVGKPIDTLTKQALTDVLKKLRECF